MTDKTKIIDATTLNKAINTKIAAIKRNLLKANDEIQAVIIMVMVHTKDHGDCTGAARLVDAMPMTHRRALVINHFAAYSPIRVTKDNKGNIKAHLAREGTEGYTAFDIDKAQANRWDQAPDVNREPGIMTIEDADEKVIKMADAIERKISRNQVAEADIARLTKLAADLRATAKANDPASPAPKGVGAVKGEPKTAREDKALGGSSEGRTGTDG